VTRSDLTPLERNITDYRYPECHKYKYDLDQLPTITVIIIFHNDALSMILRTVHSILMRTPDKLLSQVACAAPVYCYHCCESVARFNVVTKQPTVVACVCLRMSSTCISLRCC